MSHEPDVFPRQVARTRGSTLGVPRSFSVSPDGERVVFLRSRAGDDPVSCLWALEVGSGVERCALDPMVEEDEAELSPAERARRERARERASGVTAYSTDEVVRLATASVAGRLFLIDLSKAESRELATPGPVDDPRLDPAGRQIAYVIGGALHVRSLHGEDRLLAEDPAPNTFWGLPEFVAAEEMGRHRGHWWSPDGSKLAATHVDERGVRVWDISDPADPAASPRAVRYPQAGTADAVVTLHVFDVASGDRVQVVWDRETFPYLARAEWGTGALILLVQSRDQRTVRLLEADASSGRASLVVERTDPDWIDLFDGTPVRLSDGRLVEVVSDREADTNRLVVGGETVTPPGLQVRSVLSAGEGVLFRASTEPTEIDLWRWTDRDGPVRLSEDAGVHSGAEGGSTLVRTSAGLDRATSTTEVLRDGRPVATIANLAESPVVDPKPEFLSLGERELRAALLLPGGVEPDDHLPVLLDLYGGPHGARVLRSAGAFLTSQWLADQGFAVLVVDNRGVDGRGPSWDRRVRGNLALGLEDQVDALRAAAERFAFLDLSRVAVRGWSFGGTLAALAVLRRPDVFHAAVVGAPVTDWRLYDTHYTERYLGHPDEEPRAYADSSPIGDAATLERPMLLIHGLVDDNVFVVHSLRLSAALFEAGRHHELLLIPNATHVARATAVTENLFGVQLDFLRRTLAT